MIALFRIPKFAPFWASKALSEIGNGVTMGVWLIVLLNWFDMQGMAWCMAAMAVGSTVGSFVGGVAADRWSRTLVMMGGDALAALLLMVFIACYAARTPLWSVLLICCTIGFAESLYSPAHRAAIAQIVSDSELLVAANSLEGWTSKGGRMLGLTLGGVFAGAGAPVAGLWVDVASYLLSMAFLAWVALPAVTRECASTLHPVRELREGLREVRVRPWVMAVMVQGTVQVMLVYGVLGPLLADFYHHHYGDASLAWVRIAESAGGIVGALATPWLARIFPAKVMGWVAMTALVPTLAQCLLVSSAWPMWGAIAAGFVTFAGVGVFMPLWFSALQKHIPHQAQGRVFALDSAIQFAGMPLGYALAPWIMGVLGATGVTWLTSSALLVTTFGVFVVRGVASLGADGSATPRVAS